MRTRLTQFMFAGISIAALGGCDGPKLNDVVGDYVRTNGSEAETLKLKADGTFEQIVRYSDSQTWTLKETWTLHRNVVRLERYYEVYDFERDTPLSPPRLFYMSNYVFEGDKIIANENDKFPYVKSNKN